MPTLTEPNYEITGLLPSFQYAGKEYMVIGTLICNKCGSAQDVRVSKEGVATLEPRHSVECMQ